MFANLFLAATTCGFLQNQIRCHSVSFSCPHMSHSVVSSSWPASLRRHFVQIALTTSLRSDDDSSRESRPPLLSATRLATSSEALVPVKCEESASFAAACLWFVLQTAALSMDLSRAGEVVVSRSSVLLSSKNWKGEGQVPFHHCPGSSKLLVVAICLAPRFFARQAD